jgi:hypothetical protein
MGHRDGRSVIMPILKLVTRSDSERYAHALRTIGQDLARLVPENLEIEVMGDNYIVRCQTRHHSIEAKSRKTTALKDVFKRLVGKKSSPGRVASKPDLVPINRTYTPADIDGIYGQQIVDRTRLGRNPDLYSLGERLRMIGRIVHSKHGQLIKLFVNKNSVTFEYCDQNGKARAEEISHFALFRLQQRYWSQRQTNKQKDVWEDTDR